MKAFCVKVLTGIHGVVRRIQYNAPVVLTFAIVSFIVLLVSMMTKGASTHLLFSVYRAPLTDPFTYVRFFGYALGHADFDHFFNNIIIILLVGPMLEEKYGSKRLALMIAVTVLVSGILFFIVNGANAALLGASGVVFMMIILSSFVNLSKGRIPLTLLLCVIVFIGREVMAGVMLQDNISRMTHIAGGLCGAGLGFWFNRKKLFPDKTEIKEEEITVVKDEA